MRTARLLIGLAALAMPIALAGPAAANEYVPADCAVPPEAGIDLSQFNIIIGTNASQTIRGTEGPDFICARLGNDTIFAGGGSDLILGDTTTFFGDVNAYGGYGNDFIALAVADDYGDGGPGADNMNGRFGVDTLSGGDGSDMISGGP